MLLELDKLLEELQDRQDLMIDGFPYYKGNFSGVPILLARSYIGPINAALSTHLALRNFPIRAVISQGVAGAQVPDLTVGDLVICRKSCYLEAIGSAFRGLGQGLEVNTWTPFSPEHCTTEGVLEQQPYYESDPRLMELALEMAPEYKATGELINQPVQEAENSPSPGPQLEAKQSNFVSQDKQTLSYGKRGKVVEGVLGTGYSWVRELDRISWNNRVLGVTVVDMESTAVAQVCRAFRVPSIIVRVVSDNSYHRPPEDGMEYFDAAVAYGCQYFSRDLAIRYWRETLAAENK